MCASNSSTATNSRRRACLACQQSKRRCDQRIPRCGRCLSKGLLSCSYPALEAVTSSTVNIDPTLSDVGEAPHIEYFANTVLGTGSTGVVGRGESVFRDFTNPTHPGESQGHPGIFPTIPRFQDNAWPRFFHADSLSTHITRESMIYCVAQFRSWPARWVTEAIASFIHPALYASTPFETSRSLPSSFSNLSGLPPVLQDAFSVCAAYAAKNDLNSGLVMNLVESKSTALLYSPDQGNWTVSQQLAALQALNMYQMMRLFDGDARQRSLGEAAEPVLASWTTSLQAHVGAGIFDGSDIHSAAFGERQASLSGSDYSGSIDSSLGVPEGIPARHGTPIGQETAIVVNEGITSTWRQWLFNETLRRTIITSYMIRGTYAISRQGYSHLSSVIYDMSFTSCSRLWAATTAGRWKRARETVDPGWISGMNFNDMLSSADPRNVDEFAVMMAVTYRGKDAVEDWMACGTPQRQRSV